MLKNKTIILGVTGCIAAYKSAEIVRLLKKLNAEVWVAMTKEAAKLVTPLTFRTLSGNPVITDLFSEELSKLPVPHVSLTQRADLVLVAPATANILAKTSNGIADDPITTMLLAAKCPVIFAPAMNTAMWEKEATRDNVSRLKLRGHKFIGPEVGPLACGDEGPGRLSPVETIIEEVKKELLPSLDLLGLRILVTAGPTREKIDPVRFISNRSSGKMGYAIAEAASKRGAEVTLISGPTNLSPPDSVQLVKIETADEMYNEVKKRFNETNALVMAAAVADFKPKIAEKQKIKKAKHKDYIELADTPDILKELSRVKKDQVLIGFSLETDNLAENSIRKLEEKCLDIIIANDASALDSEENKAVIIRRGGGTEELPRLRKIELAGKILDKILQ
jgi:phosphopantothenoylcysteine decarboxylase/phosphopantothenate--cysteine ligase